MGHLSEPGGGGGSATGPFLTWQNAAGALPASRQLLAGTGMTFDDSVANQRTINGALPYVASEYNPTVVYSSNLGSGAPLVTYYQQFGEYVSIQGSAIFGVNADGAVGLGLDPPVGNIDAARGIFTFQTYTSNAFTMGPADSFAGFYFANSVSALTAGDLVFVEWLITYKLAP